MEADAAYRRFVLPLSIFLMGGGLMLACGSFFLPVTGPAPFIRSESTNQIIFFALSLFLAFDGLGLLLKHRWAWMALQIYCLAGILLFPLGTLDPMMRSRMGIAGILIGTLLNGVMFAGIYWGAAPVFRRRC